MISSSVRGLFLVTVVVALAQVGCGPKQPDFEALHPVTGKVTRGGMPVVKGALRFTSIPEKPEFMVVSEVDENGGFTLTTVRSTDSRGERKAGAPAGEYTVVYVPMNEDQTKGFSPPVTLPQKIVIEAKDNQLELKLP